MPDVAELVYRVLSGGYLEPWEEKSLARAYEALWAIGALQCDCGEEQRRRAAEADCLDAQAMAKAYRKERDEYIALAVKQARTINRLEHALEQARRSRYDGLYDRGNKA